MPLLAVKVLLAPAFVVAASLAARRYGPRIGGLIAGLPVVAGPILLVYALQHGDAFAAHASVGALLGLVSLIAFVVVYARLAPSGFWGHCALAGWGAFAVATLIFSQLRFSAGVALAIAGVAFVVGLTLAPKPASEPPPAGPAPSWDLPLRALCALVLVLALTAAAGWLGPRWSGLLTPFPVIGTVLATFTHAQHGADVVRRMLRWLLAGYGAFALFCFTLAETLVPLGTAASFALALAIAVLVQGTLILAIARVHDGRLVEAPTGEPSGLERL
ncbi:MAG TPA: hypothetical protein VMA83_03095 [Solirubrobacteraceae bacterium]|nr:hypothetical protein [Solirubrobacteraceae bacterium]